jgi:hypothetical protein
VDVDGLPFVVCVGSDRIYTGAFWTPLSSLIFDGVVVMQPMEPDRNVIEIGIGYPSPAYAEADPRSDAKVLGALESAGKLK